MTSRYWAFVSYSHRDRAWGDWLHRAIETYRLPRRLVGTSGRDGPVPRRLYPIFRDREELPGSADLASNIDDALRASRALVVICSPHAAASRWVNQEIAIFKRLGGEGRTLALIVDGEPNASDRPDSGLVECFPPALRYRVRADGTPGDQRAEPVAADIRAGADSRRSALLKLVAGIAGVPYDALRQRDRRRRRVRQAIAAAAGVAIVACAAVGWRWRVAERETDALIASGRGALLTGDTDTAAAWLSAAYSRGAAGANVRFMLRQAMTTIDARRLTVATDCAPISAGAYSADGSRLAYGCGRNGVEVRQAADGAKVAGFQTGALFLHDIPHLDTHGRHVVVAEGAAAGVYDVATGRRVLSLPMGADAEVESVRFARSDEWVIAAGENLQRGSTRVFRRADGALLRELDGDARSRSPLTLALDSNAADLAVSPAGTICVHDAHETRLVRIVDGAVIRRFPSTGHCVLSEEQPTALWIRGLAQDRANAVEVFDTADGHTIVRVPLDRFGPESGRLPPGPVPPSSFATIGIDMIVKRWTSDTGTLIDALPLQEFMFDFAEFAPSGTVLVTRLQDGRHVSVWQVGPAAAPAVAFLGVGAGLFLHPRDDELVAAGGRRVRFLRLDTVVRPVPATIDGLDLAGIDGAFRTAVFANETRARWRRLADGAVLYDAAMAGVSARTVRLAPDGGAVAVRGAAGWHIWRAPPATSFDIHAGRDFLQFVDRGRAVAALDAGSHALVIWSVDSARETSRLPVPAGDAVVRVSDDGRRAIVWHPDAAATTGPQPGFVDVYDLSTRARTAHYHVESGGGDAAFRGGEIVRIISATEIVRERLPDGVMLARWGGFDNELQGGIAVSPDGRRVIVRTGRLDSTVQVLDIDDGRPLAKRRGLLVTPELWMDGDAGRAVMWTPRAGNATVLDIGLETRSPADIARRVACAVPFAVTDGRLVTSTPPPDCALHR